MRTVGMLLLFLGSSCSSVPSSSELAKAYIEARGGMERLSELPAVVRQGRIVIQLGSEIFQGTYRTCVAYPTTGVVHIDAGKVQIAEVIVEASQAYECSAGFAHCTPASAQKTQDLIETAEQANREVIYALELWSDAGHVVDAGDVWRVTAEETDDITVEYVFDKKTALLREKSRQNTNQHRRRAYSDWRHVDGVMFPFVIEDTSLKGTQTLRIELESTEIVDHLGDAWCAEVVSGVP